MSAEILPKVEPKLAFVVLVAEAVAKLSKQARESARLFEERGSKEDAAYELGISHAYNAVSEVLETILPEGVSFNCKTKTPIAPVVQS